MSDTTEMGLLLELMKEIKSGQTESVANLKDSISDLSTTVSKMDDQHHQRFEKIKNRDEEIFMKVDATSALSASLKDDHMQLKKNIQSLERDVKKLNRLRNFVVMIFGGFASVIGLFYQEILALFKKVLIIISQTNTGG